LESHRADLRQFLQWATGVGLLPLTASRAHIELSRASMEQRGLAPASIDRRLSTVCGYYRFAHIDGRIASNPAQYVRRPRVHTSSQRGMDRGELAAFLYSADRTSPMHAALAVLLGLNGLRFSEACGANIEDLGFERGHRTLLIVGKGDKPAGIPLVPRTAAPSTWRSVSEPADRSCCAATDSDSTPAPPTAGCAPSATERGLTGFTRMLRAAFIMAALDAGVALRDVQIAARHAEPAPPPSTTGADRTTTATPPTPSSPSSPAGSTPPRHRRPPMAAIQEPRSVIAVGRVLDRRFRPSRNGRRRPDPRR
jgi:integrase